MTNQTTQTTQITSFKDIQNRLIAVDTEYQSIQNAPAQSRIERETTIHKVWCASFSHNEKAFSIWAGNEDSMPDILDRAAKHFDVPNPIFVNYAYFAEWEAFSRLGVDMSAYDWIDVHLLYRILSNAYTDKVETTLVSMCKEILGISIDSEHKEAMRELCISGNVTGNESQIMSYCEEDTRHLIPALFSLEDRLNRRLALDVTMPVNCRHRGDRTTPVAGLIMELMESLKAFTTISHRGIPVNGDRLKSVRKGARIVRDKQIREFVEKYPGTWDFITPSTKSLDKIVSEEERLDALKDTPFEAVMDEFKKLIENKSIRTQAVLCGQYDEWHECAVKGTGGSWKRDDKECRRFLLADLKSRGLLEGYPLTDTGKLSLSKDALKDTFGKQTGTFGGDFRVLMNKITCYNGILADGKSDWLSAYDENDGLMRYRTLNPLSTVTWRCAPSPSNGWVFGWDKSLYSVIEPPEGRWLVELDFSSEETFIQAQVFNDPAYRELYASKDIYLYTGVLTGMIPRSDFDSMSQDDLKAKYKQQRDLLKTFTLAIGYGAGNKTLAGKTGLPLSEVEKFRRNYDKAFSRTMFVRDELKKRMESGRLKCLWLANGLCATLNRHKVKTSFNAPLNYPIQGTGSVILSKVARDFERAGIRTIATIHDAVVFEVGEGDMETIHKARTLMKDAADYVLNVQEGEEGMKVGEPEIIKHGEIWTPEHAFDDQAREILNAGGYAC